MSKYPWSRPVRTKLPESRIINWRYETMGLSLEQKGLLIDISDWVCQEGRLPNEEERRRMTGCDVRVLRRLWTPHLEMKLRDIIKIKKGARHAD